jgi:hypothetical protein
MKEYIVAFIDAGGTVLASVIAVLIAKWLGSKGGHPPTPPPPPPPPEGDRGPSQIRPRPKPIWPPAEKQGVWMVRLRPEYTSSTGFPLPPDTFVHFSFDLSGPSTCYLRNYSIPGPPTWIKPSTPEEVWRNIEDQVVVYRKNERATVIADKWWYSETLRLNREIPVSDQVDSR